MEEKTKKRMKTWEKVLVIILILLAIFAIDTYRKFSIIHKVDRQYEKDIKSTNFYQRVEHNGLGRGMSEVFVYQSKRMYKETLYKEHGKIERMLYSDSDKKETWLIVDNGNETKEAVKMEYQENAPIGAIGSHTGGVSMDPWTGFLSAVMAKVTTDKWSNKDCYKIQWGKEMSLWVDKQTNRTIGEKNGYSTRTEGYVIDNIGTYYYQENGLTDEKVKLPDLTSYKITDTTQK